MIISICISTRRRPKGLERLLYSIDNIQLPENVLVHIVVVENDETTRLKEVIDGYLQSGRFKLRYYLEKNAGIAYARNRSVRESGECDYCCFVDDDQIVDKRWLVELLSCRQEFEADGVSGVTPPLFEFEVPEFIRKYHTDGLPEYGEEVEMAATGCLLISKKYLEMIEGPFDLRLNYTGGEDFYMTYQATQMGATIRSNPYAISYEIIPRDRATIQYVYRRTVRVANTQLYVRSLIGRVSYLVMLPKIFGRLLLGIVILIPYWLLADANKLLGLFKISYSMGQLMYIFGRKNRFYSE